jgi:hypothetical protein
MLVTLGVFMGNRIMGIGIVRVVSPLPVKDPKPGVSGRMSNAVASNLPQS